MTALEALESWENSRRVESAYKHQAKKAQRAYIAATRTAPRDDTTERLSKLHREAVSQWAQAQRDAAAARKVWLRACKVEGVSLHKSASGAQFRLSGPIGGQNGAQVQHGPVRPLEVHRGLPA